MNFIHSFVYVLYSWSFNTWFRAQQIWRQDIFICLSLYLCLLLSIHLYLSLPLLPPLLLCAAVCISRILSSVTYHALLFKSFSEIVCLFIYLFHCCLQSFVVIHYHLMLFFLVLLMLIRCDFSLFIPICSPFLFFILVHCCILFIILYLT